ncbi:ModD protein [Ruficoccus sp. ZRK36]|uniref:ModD protein n=1 Tax=Ruficoccus sp. ZRK36 TaxID=2866311 RepID=UPI001C72B135|nr:ModD protein [Ruficoccus sp. ZRK36]QYY34720.1 ModD protein [Ruficoccus sp. ZRK36]
MLYFSDEDIDQLIREDLPYLDLTSTLLEIGEQPGRLRYITRQPTTICATEEARRILEKLGLAVTISLPTGTQADAGTCILEARGPAAAVHAAWRVTGNLLEHASGVATRTRTMVDKVHAVNPQLVVVTTRKSIPFARKLTIKGILAGGAFPHRLGLSESVLVFDEHLRFIGGRSEFLKKVSALKTQLGEKLIAAEAHDVESALELARGGVDLVQLDKLSLADTRQVAETVHTECPGVKVSIAGGVNLDNCADYAATGVDMIVTSALYFGKPADIKAEIEAL